MTDLLDDLRLAARSLAREPVATVSVIATLAICIGGTTAAFSVAYGVLVRGLPYRDPEELVWVASVRPDRPDAPFSLPEYMDFQERARTIDLAAYATWSATFGTASLPRRLQGLRASGNFFEVLGASPTAGRLLQKSDDSPGAPPVAVLSYAMWQGEFAGDPEIIGRRIDLNGEPRTVVGILPAHFPMQIRDVDVVAPLTPESDARRHNRSSVNFLRMVGRPRGETPPAMAEREVAAIAKDLRDRFPIDYAAKVGVRFTPLRQYLIGDLRQTLAVVLGCSSLLLAIALANVLNLLMVRATSRQGEIAVRRALGASTARIASVLVSEGVVLAGVGGVIGSALAYVALKTLAGSASSVLPRIDEIGVDSHALAVTSGVVLLAVALFSVFPLGIAVRVPPQSALRASGRSQVGSAQRRLRASFIVAQIALAVILTAVTATVSKSLIRLQHVNLGFRTDSVFIARLSLPSGKYRSASDLIAFHAQLADALRADPEVLEVGAASIAPFTGLLARVNFWVAGRPPKSNQDQVSANFRVVSPGYFKAIRASILAGRLFTEDDGPETQPVAIVSRRLVERQMAGLDPLGLQVMVDDNSKDPRALTIVGVVDDLRYDTVDGAPTADIYTPFRQIHAERVEFVTGSQFWAVRVKTDPARYAPAFAKVLQRTDRAAATAGLGTLQAYVERSLASRRLTAVSLLGYAALALLLSAIGVYGVMAYGVEQRRREIGVRLALGASPHSVVALMLQSGIRLALVGAVVGVAGTLVCAQLLAGMLFGVSARDPSILVSVALLLIGTSLFASWIPARRASRIDAIQAITS